MAITTTSLKRGDTLSLSGFLPVGALPAGNWAALCAIFAKLGGIKHTITATLTPPAGLELRYLLELYAPKSETELWAPGKYIGDVEFTDASAEPEPFTITSANFTLIVEADVTTP